ncbi:MAG: acetate kinase [Candidatus Omnitrophica bacterium]|nr:acetate kinase [Candidatus Omnitrophota bacterium]
MKILVVNCGSSSIKYQLFEMPEEKVLAKGMLEKIGEKTADAIHDHHEGMRRILKDMHDIKAVGHRVVHGGEYFKESSIIDEKVLKIIEDYADLAPLHNPHNLTGIKAASQALPNVPQVASFDTAFHQTIPSYAYLYAIPYELYEKYRIRRYGFHGTSHRYVARRAAELENKGKYDLNIITCHLGNGCSITAVKKGKSIDTSMGLTPLEGVVMGTRSGDIDPAIIFYLAERRGMKIKEINNLLNKKSGLLGFSGISNDVREVRKAANKGNKRAELALDIFCYRIKKYIGAYMAALGHVDTIVFTGGIGENADRLRREILEGLEELGIKLDKQINDKTHQCEALISSPDSRIKVWVIPTDEEARIAHDAYLLMEPL